MPQRHQKPHLPGQKWMGLGLGLGLGLVTLYDSIAWWWPGESMTERYAGWETPSKAKRPNCSVTVKNVSFLPSSFVCNKCFRHEKGQTHRGL